MNPNFPVVSGRYQMTRDWVVTLPTELNRRVEERSLVLWRPGFTVWIDVWGNDRAESRQERLDWLRSGTSPDAFDDEVLDDGGLTRYAYRLNEQRDTGAIVQALYCFAIGAKGHVHAAVYFDDEADLLMAKQIWRSFEEIAAA